MASSALRPLLEPFIFELIKWTGESIMPSRRTDKRSRDRRTDLFEWSRTFGGLLARVTPFVALDIVRNEFIKPFLADNDEALSVLARFVDYYVRRYIMDVGAIPEISIAVLDECVSRVVQDRSFRPKEYRAGEVSGYAMPEVQRVRRGRSYVVLRERIRVSRIWRLRRQSRSYIRSTFTLGFRGYRYRDQA
jgi:hypothetical protein